MKIPSVRVLIAIGLATVIVSSSYVEPEQSVALRPLLSKLEEICQHGCSRAKVSRIVTFRALKVACEEYAHLPYNVRNSLYDESPVAAAAIDTIIRGWTSFQAEDTEEELHQIVIKNFLRLKRFYIKACQGLYETTIKTPNIEKTLISLRTNTKFTDEDVKTLNLANGEYDSIMKHFHEYHISMVTDPLGKKEKEVLISTLALFENLSWKWFRDIVHDPPTPSLVNQKLMMAEYAKELRARLIQYRQQQQQQQ